MSNNHIEGNLAYFAEIILPLSIPKSLTYGIPPHLFHDVQEGSRVVVSLGKKKLLTGIVNKLHQIPPPYATKNIMDVLDESPILNKQQLTFFQWMAQYYMCTLGDVLKAALPSGFKLSSQSKICLHPSFDEANATFSAQETALIEALKKGKILSYQQVERLVGPKEAYKLLKNLMHQEAIMFLEEIQEKYFPKKEKQVSLNKNYVEDSNALELLFQQLEKKPKQLDILLQYMTFLTGASEPKKNYWINKKSLLQQGISSSSLQNLVQQGVFVEKEITVSRIAQTNDIATTAHAMLSPAQTQALSVIKANFNHKNSVLLHGVTGSGKTEIYTELIQEVLERQGQVLYLLPEIGLATQIVQRLKKIFGNQMGVYHSKYASNERVEIWNDVLTGKLRLVVGVRSALFLPFGQLQLIIVDEEHEVAYKQFDGTPRYHARDAAIMLATHHQSKVLLGSATPAVETYYNAQHKKYGLVKLTERFSQTSLPKITLVNLRTEQRHKKLQGEFSSTLIQALEEVFRHQEQAIIFQNRRGYASYILCQTCAWVPTCQQCSVSLTYHQFKDYLVCHYCGYHLKLPPVCQECGSHTLRNMGFGTEKIEETLQQFFPDKRIQRMDLDTTRKKHSYEKIIANLEKGYTDILVGTQMVTKGLDFGQVSLVGVLDLDRLLYFPDFRANERCFQLITQVSGRAGRRDKQGQVIIQTANPNHPILQDIIDYNYEQMYQKELLERQKFRYPPYVRLIKITCQHPNESLVKESGRYLTQQLHQFLDVDSILGPEAPLIAKVKNQYRMDIWVKLAKSTDHLLLVIKEQIQAATKRVLTQKPYRQVKVIFDVDPI